MKLINYSTLTLFVVLLFCTCSTSSRDSKEKNTQTKTVTQDFTAKLTGTYIYVGPDTLVNPKCTDTLNTWRAIVSCEGTSNLMGDIQALFDFCGNEKGHYGNVFAYIIDTNSDTLFVECHGQVIDGRLGSHPEHVTSYWQDDFAILGGTGKYKDATGTGKTDDYNSSKDPNSHHNWTGKITMSAF